MKCLPYRTLLLLSFILLAIIVPFCLYGAAIDAWAGRVIDRAAEHRLAAGALLAALLASDILLPVPSSLVSTACGLALGFAGGTLASFLGMSFSTAAGYLLGRFASAPAESLIGLREVELLRAFTARHGLWMLLALRPVPVLAEASALFSGLARQPFGRAMAVAALGNLAVSAVYAAVGAWGRLSDSFLLAFAASLSLAGLLLLAPRLTRALRAAAPSA